MKTIAVHTAESIAKVRMIKNLVKRENVGFNYEMPKEFVEKRNYMQSDAFLEDEHNKKMFALGNKLAELRETLNAEAAEKAKSSKPKYVQGFDGLIRIKDAISKFLYKPMFFTTTEGEYVSLSGKMHTLSESAKKDINHK